MLKKIILLLSAIITTNSFAHQLHHFDEVSKAALKGKNLHITIDFSQCTGATQSKTAPSLVGVFTPNEMQVSNNHIVTSFMHFTLNNPRFPNLPVYEFVTYNINNENNVILTYQVLSAIDYSILSEKSSFSCKINASARIFSD